MSAQEIKLTVSEYLARFFPGHALKENEDIFKLGFVNSMFAMQLVTFVEHKFRITIENEDLELDNFRTIEAISRLVERKAGGGNPRDRLQSTSGHQEGEDDRQPDP